MSKTNPHNIYDGEPLPLVGGPKDGGLARVGVLFPMIDGGICSQVCKFGDHFYSLDMEKRQWVY